MKLTSSIFSLVCLLLLFTVTSCRTTSLNLEKRKASGSSKDSSTIISQPDKDSSSLSSSSSECFSLDSSGVDQNICNLEALIIQKTNEYREQQGLSKLKTNKALSYTARQATTTNHSTWTAHSGFPNQRNQTLSQCHGKSGSDSNEIRSLTGENWAQYYETGSLESLASGFVNMWINSSGHRQNMIGSHTYIGVGVSKSGSNYYSIQLFAR